MYVLGIDFGTESGRVLLVDINTGNIVCTDQTKYPHGVMDSKFLDGSQLPEGWALQHPDDYLEVLRHSIPRVMNKANVASEEVIGIGLDFTASTVLPVLEDGTPLCLLDQWTKQPHSYVKLWKHHAAQKYADELNQVAMRRGESFLKQYGGEISSEWMIPKIMQVLKEAPEIYDATDRFIEAGDWVVWQLTGVETRNACAAGYKACWDRANGYPSQEFFQQLDPQLQDLIGTKIPTKVDDVGTYAGGLSPAWAQMLGLSPYTAVSVATIDAHASVPAIGVNQAGQMVIAMGTSFCHMLLAERKVTLEGIPGAVDGGIIPGFTGYEAGQPAGGDMLGWFIRNFSSNKEESDIHKELSEKASKIPAAGTGLLVLDWFNGNRSILMDADLSGVIIGLTLSTKAEEIYRALLESIAFGTRIIIETFEKHGVPVEIIHACGGVAVKNPLFIEILADVTGKEILVNDVDYAPAIGGAILGAVAAGYYSSIEEASEKMSSNTRKRFTPKKENSEIYNLLYQEYYRLHDMFGNGAIIKNIKELRGRT